LPIVPMQNRAKRLTRSRLEPHAFRVRYGSEQFVRAEIHCAQYKTLKALMIRVSVLRLPMEDKSSASVNRRVSRDSTEGWTNSFHGQVERIEHHYLDGLPVSAPLKRIS
jgi:hypothetical protein